jgi:hypothetical protein
MENQQSSPLVVGENGGGDLSGTRLADELAESNKRINQLLQALEEEKRRISRAEEALAKPLPPAPPEPTPIALPEIYAATLGLHESDLLGAYKPVKPSSHDQQRCDEQRQLFLSLPSVVTWFPMGKHKSSPEGMHSEETQADHSFPEEVAEYKLEESDVDIDCDELQQLREHESHVWCCTFHPSVP